MFQSFYLFRVITLVGLLAAAGAQRCPPADVLAPCTCDERDLALVCSGYGDPNFDLQAVFDRVTPLIDDNTVFTFGVIDNLPPSYRQLPANLTSLKFMQLQIEFNEHLEYIHPEAFNNTYGSTVALLITGNKLNNSNEPTDNFAFFRQFPMLRWLYVEEEHLQYIPSDPWPLLTNLFKVELYLCDLVGVGSRFLANIPYLTEASITYCNMSVEGFAVGAFQGISPEVELYLGKNPIRYLPEGIFKAALDVAKSMEVGGYGCTPNCDYQRLLCDEAAVGWLCENQADYESKLYGYQCELDEAGGEDHDVWDWCRDNFNSTNSN